MKNNKVRYYLQSNIKRGMFWSLDTLNDYSSEILSLIRESDEIT